MKLNFKEAFPKGKNMTYSAWSLDQFFLYHLYIQPIKLKTHYTCVCVCVCVHSLVYAYAFSINSPVLILRRFILRILCFDCDFL